MIIHGATHDLKIIALEFGLNDDRALLAPKLAAGSRTERNRWRKFIRNGALSRLTY